MSDQQEPTPPGRSRRNPALTFLMVVIGLILLLPGLCAVVFAVLELSSSRIDPTLAGLWAVCLLISFGGIVLIRQAFR